MYPFTHGTLPFFHIPLAISPSQGDVKQLLKTVKPNDLSNSQERNRNAEPTTPSPQTKSPSTDLKVSKLRDGRQQQLKPKQQTPHMAVNLKLVKAAQIPETGRFIVEEIVPVPGRFIASSVEKVPIAAHLQKPQLRVAPKLKQIQFRLAPQLQNPQHRVALQSQKPQLRVSPQSTKPIPQQQRTQEEPRIKVTAKGHTAADKPVPDIPVGVYFAPYQQDDPFSRNSEQKYASLILEPSAKSVVGNGGTAISAPISRAILKNGVPTRVLFRPQSVAIAGAGGRAHAHADLILDFVERSTKSADSSITNLAYYGGAAGQVLQITQNDDGTITSTIIRSDGAKEIKGRDSFDLNLQNIQDAAAKLVAIQERAKKRGSFSPLDNKMYADNLHQLGVSAQELAKLQRDGDTHDLRQLFAAPPAASMPFGSGHKFDTSGFGNIEDVRDEVESDDGPDPDSVQINVPNKEAAVAEVKPVGLAIAGAGGVASSKPAGTAVSGAEGLALAQPIATAIAGLTPDELQKLGFSIPHRVRSETLKKLSAGVRNKYALREDGVLAGPVDNRQYFLKNEQNNKDDTEIIENTTVRPTAAPPTVFESTTVMPIKADGKADNNEKKNEPNLQNFAHRTTSTYSGYPTFAGATYNFPGYSANHPLNFGSLRYPYIYPFPSVQNPTAAIQNQPFSNQAQFYSV